MTKHFFLSYSSADCAMADSVDSAFSRYGIAVVRDVRDLKYKQSIKAFMQQVRTSDYVIMVISDAYLKSPNCMYEVLEFVKEQNYRNRVIPLIQRRTDIFRPEGRIKYLDYWTGQVAALRKQTKRQQETYAIPLIRDLRQYEQISAEISEFLGTLSDMKSVVFSRAITDAMMATVFNYLGVAGYAGRLFVLKLERKRGQQPDALIDSIRSMRTEVAECNVKDAVDTKLTLLLSANARLSIRKVKETVKAVVEQHDMALLELFPMEKAFYILSKVKTLLFDKHVMYWWAPHSRGYTDTLATAGLYTRREVFNYIFRPTGFEDHSVLGIPKSVFDTNIGLNVVPDNGEFRNRIAEIGDALIGRTNWDGRWYRKGKGEYYGDKDIEGDA